MKCRYLLTIAAALCLMVAVPEEAHAQRWSLGTNIVDYVNLGTLNAEGNVAVARRLTLNAGARYNPWTFRYGDEDRQFENRKRCFYAGVRYWPWHVHSGWWAGVKGQYQEYNRGGLFGSTTEEGTAWGFGLSVGYSLMVGKSFNIEFGAGAWAGRSNYATYSCAFCGKVLDHGVKTFLWPDNLMVSLVYIL